jgi:hypothetical protein
MKIRTSGVWVLPDVFFDLELIGARLVFGDDAPDDRHATLLDVVPQSAEVIVKVTEADFGDDGRAGLGDELVLFSEGCEESFPAGDDGVFVAVHEAELQFAEAVWQLLCWLSREGGERVRNVAFNFTSRAWIHRRHGGDVAANSLRESSGRRSIEGVTPGTHKPG